MDTAARIAELEAQLRQARHTIQEERAWRDKWAKFACGLYEELASYRAFAGLDGKVDLLALAKRENGWRAKLRMALSTLQRVGRMCAVPQLVANTISSLEHGLEQLERGVE